MKNKRNLFIIISLLVVIIVIIARLHMYSCKIACSKPPCRISSGEDITFFVSADPHYFAKELNNCKEAFNNYITTSDGKLLAYSEELIDAFLRDVKKNEPDVLIICGDLTNNGEKESHENLAKKLDYVQNSGTSVFVIPGNHDVKNPWACKFEHKKKKKTNNIRDKDFSKIYGSFGYDEAISRDENSLSYLAAPSDDIWLLMLDTNQYHDNMIRNSPQADGIINPNTIKWIKKCSQKAKKENVQLMAVMHHSLLDHNPVKNEGYTLNNSKEVINLFQDCDIELVLTGHIHFQDIKLYENDKKQIYDIATSSLSVYPHTYGILKYSPNSGYEYSTSWIDMEGYAKENNIHNENIQNFKEYSRSYFIDRSYFKFYEEFYDIKEYKDREMDLMSKTLADLNSIYYEGKGEIDIEKIKSSEGFKLLESIGIDSLKKYAESIFDTNGIDSNNLKIPKK
ncbi:metallophosphoesterase [Tissierella sp. MSJ-40]|uniref:Metallophosphoesterase n=1 Tax=Tissierella simiarum TaxID=2841534 RepID=A0ABS6E365_9FIRM|nr:metallophosphoesterase [Tissierella simiarum]MBU5437358.1 metallophosphoesterase [Tissierella simiarum]